jgi:hypothetical protein
MNCILHALDLFKTNTCEATTIAVIAFLLGVVAMCVVCKLFCKPCGGAKCNSGKQPQRRSSPGEQRPFEKRKPHPAPADGSVEIYVGNLSYDMTEDQLRAEFEAFGKVNSVRLVMNRFNGKSKGFGFIQMPNRDEAERACAAINDKEIMGRRVKCNEAKNLI